MAIYLRTERLVLREFTQDDAELLLALDADPAVMRYTSGGRPTPRAEIDERLARYLEYHRQGAGFGFWAAIERATGSFLGWFHFRPLPESPAGEVELGYRLHQHAWGKGYATEASRALIDKGFTDHSVLRVTASTMVVNVASRRVMEKCGLRYQRTFHQEWPDKIEGDEFGDVEYALTRTEWCADAAHR